MIIHDIDQHSPEWYQVRLGIPTASRFKDIYTSTGKASASADAYMHTLLAEELAGKPLESFESDWMRRGTELEPSARAFYELRQNVELEVVGFVTNDEKTAGCSPDAMGLELKCPAPHTHVKYLLGGKCPAEYFPQVQGCIWICERDWWDFMSYHPDLPPFIIRVERDESYIKGLSAEIDKFLEKMDKQRQRLKAA